MPLWDTVKQWFDSNTQHLTREFLPGTGGDIEPHNAYFRLWLADMFIAKDRRWGIDRHPAVHATVRLGYAGRSTDITSVISPPAELLGPGPRQNYPLTTLLPYAGGVVELEAGLSEIQGHNAVAAAIGALQDVSSLIGPPISQALAVADKVAAGVQGLLQSGEAGIVLGIHDAFTAPKPGGGGAGGLQEGHLICIGTPPGTVAAADLAVVGGRLQHRGQPLEGYDYLVFHIERCADRDDWRFADLEALIDRAKDAILAHDTEAFGAFKSAALASVLKSRDLTRSDRTRLALTVKEELDEAEILGQGAIGEDRPTLARIVATRAMPATEARLTPTPTLQALLA